MRRCRVGQPGEEVQVPRHLPGVRRDRLRSASRPDASLSSASAALPARGICDTLHSVRFSNMSVIHEEAAWVWTGATMLTPAGFRR